MTENYNINTLNAFLSTSPSEDDIVRWFAKMNNVYKKNKKNGKINDEVMIKLVEFWHDISDEFGEDLFLLLENRWNGDMPLMVKDILDFTPKYHQFLYEQTMKKLDPTERREADSLFKAIWDKNMRLEGSVSYYDWDEDRFFEGGLKVPRKNRDGFEPDLRRVCANVIYNRGNMFLKFFARRGAFEIAGVHVGDGQGVWECLTKAEIQSSYTDDNGNPTQFEDNETVIFLDRDEPAKTDNVLYFH